VTTIAFALRARTFRSLRRHRNYRIFFTGQLVSLAGTWMQNVALAWLVIELSGSPLAIGALALWRFVPFTIFGLVAGVVADRIESRKLVMATQAAAMAISIALAVVTLTDTATLPLVYVLAALGGIALAFDAPGRQSLTFQMVGPRELPNAVALNSGLFNGSRVIGPAIAGLVIAAVGTGICFVLNAVSFLAVLSALAIVRAEELYPVAKDRSATIVGGLRRAASFAWNDPQLRLILSVVTVVSTVGFNFHVLVPLLAADTLHRMHVEDLVVRQTFGIGLLVSSASRVLRARVDTANMAAGRRFAGVYVNTPASGASLEGVTVRQSSGTGLFVLADSVRLVGDPGIVFARNTYLTSSPATVHNLLRALDAATRWANANPEKAAEIAAKALKATPASMLALIQTKNIYFNFDQDLVDELTAEAAFLQEQNLLPKTFVVKDWLAPQYMKAVFPQLVTYKE